MKGEIRRPGLRASWLAGLWSGLLAGLILAFAESLAVLIGAAVCFVLALGLSRVLSHRLAPRWPSLLSPRLTRQKIYAALGLLAGLGLVFWCCGRLSASGEGSRIRAKQQALKGPAPSVILLVIDSLRADHLSSNGYELPTSPALDLLAANGAAFPSTVASSSWTLPAHASLFTGLYPSGHGAYSHFSALGPDNPTLAEILARSGYYALSVYANPLLGGATGLDRGFDRALGVGNRQKTSLTITRPYRKFLGGGSTSQEILDISLRWIARCREANVPYFIFLNVLEAHAPLRPREPYFREFIRDLPLDEVQWPLIRELTAGGTPRGERQAVLSRLRDVDLAVLARLYDSNVRFVDQMIGAWTAALKDLGELDRTLLVVTSDHGEALGGHGQLEHGSGQLFDSVLRIPLVFHFPPRVAARKEQRLVSQVDVLPSVLDLLDLGERIPAGIQGTSLFSGGGRKPILAEFWDDRNRRFARALYADNMKLVREGEESVGLYDLAGDPQERTNLVRSRPGEASRLGEELERILANSPRPAQPPGEKKREDIERLLRSLGYIK